MVSVATRTKGEAVSSQRGAASMMGMPGLRSCTAKSKRDGVVGQAVFHGLGEVAVTGVVGQLRGRAGRGQHRIFHHLVWAQLVGRGAPVADLQRGGWGDPQGAQLPQQPRPPGEHQLGGEQQRSTISWSSRWRRGTASPCRAACGGWTAARSPGSRARHCPAAWRRPRRAP